MLCVRAVIDAPPFSADAASLVRFFSRCVRYPALRCPCQTTILAHSRRHAATKTYVPGACGSKSGAPSGGEVELLGPRGMSASALSQENSSRRDSEKEPKEPDQLSGLLNSPDDGGVFLGSLSVAAPMPGDECWWLWPFLICCTSLRTLRGRHTVSTRLLASRPTKLNSSISTRELHVGVEEGAGGCLFARGALPACARARRRDTAAVATRARRRRATR